MKLTRKKDGDEYRPGRERSKEFLVVKKSEMI